MSYVLKAADKGKRLRATVLVQNSVGSASKATARTGIVTVS
jgi:hypothetical protein